MFTYSRIATFSRCLLFCVLFGLMLAMPSSAHAAKARVLKFCHHAMDTQPAGIAANHFAKLVNEKSQGTLEVQVFPNNQLGNNRQLVEQLKLGALDLASMGLGSLGYLEDRYMIMQTPYTFRDQEHIHKVLDSPLGKELEAALLKSSNVRLLNTKWNSLTRHVAGNRPIREPKDLVGYKIRAGNRPGIVGLAAMGASPLSVPLPEMYISLQQGVSDGAELPIDFIVGYSINEVTKFLNLTYHTYGTQYLAVSEPIWKTLTPAQQKAIQDAADETMIFLNKMIDEVGASFVKELEGKGMTVVNSNVAALAQTLRDNLPTLEKDWPGLTEYFNRIQEIK